MIAALKANVHPVRIVRHNMSIEQYGKNYFGDLTNKDSGNPFEMNDFENILLALVFLVNPFIYTMERSIKN